MNERLNNREYYEYVKREFIFVWVLFIIIIIYSDMNIEKGIVILFLEFLNEVYNILNSFLLFLW